MCKFLGETFFIYVCLCGLSWKSLDLTYVFWYNSLELLIATLRKKDGKSQMKMWKKVVALVLGVMLMGTAVSAFAEDVMVAPIIDEAVEAVEEALGEEP